MARTKAIARKQLEAYKESKETINWMRCEDCLEWIVAQDHGFCAQVIVAYDHNARKADQDQLHVSRLLYRCEVCEEIGSVEGRAMPRRVRPSDTLETLQINQYGIPLSVCNSYREPLDSMESTEEAISS